MISVFTNNERVPRMVEIHELKTGEFMIYNVQNRELFIVPAHHANYCKARNGQDAIALVRTLARANRAQHFDSATVDWLKQAITSVPSPS
jgi:hypothetical protein